MYLATFLVFLSQLFYSVFATTPPAINCHVPILRHYAATGASVMAIGAMDEATSALLQGLGGTTRTNRSFVGVGLWNLRTEFITQVSQLARNTGITCTFVEPNTANESLLQPADVVFIDELPVAANLNSIIEKSALQAQKFLVIHGTNAMQIVVGGSVPGSNVWSAVEAFLTQHPEWALHTRYFECRGLTVLERVGNDKQAELLSEKPIVIVTPSYNNSKYYVANLESLLGQSYKNYRVIYIDDVSPDGTGDLVEKYLQQHDPGGRVTLIKNTTRCLAMKNLYNAIHSCHDDEIVVIADGDDQLAHSNVLHIINRIYQNSDTWITRGSLKALSGPGRFAEYPATYECIKNNGFRDSLGTGGFCSGHLRTFYAWLFKKIAREDFLYNGQEVLHKGEFFPTSYDVAMMLPMMEMAGFHQHFVSDVLYLYNDITSLNDFRINRPIQAECGELIRGSKKYLPRRFHDTHP